MRRHTLVIVAYLVLALVFTYPLALNFSSAIPGDGYDGLQNYWNLWWVRRALLDLNTSPFFTRELYYPTGASLLFHTLNIFNGLWSLPIQSLANLAFTYNSIVLFTFVMSGYGAYLLALEVTGGKQILSAIEGKQVARSTSDKVGHFPLSTFHFPPFLAGFVFAFAPIRFAHLLGHMQVLSTEWIPFFALTYLQLNKRGHSARRIFLPAFFLVLNALCDWYFVLYLLIFAALVSLWQMQRRTADGRRLIAAVRRLPSAVLPFASVLLLFTVLLSPLLVPMLREAASAAYLRPPFDETLALSADLLAFVTPSEFHPVWGDATRNIAEQFSSSTSERTVFAGFVPLALAIVGVMRFRRRVAFWLITLSTFFVLALGPYLHVLGQIVAPLPLPYAWLYALVPLVRITRSVSRFDLMVMLALAMLCAFGLSTLRTRAMIVCALLIAFEFLAVPYPLTPVAVPSFYAQLRDEAGAFAILELPINVDRPDPLLYQTLHARPLITAYTSRSNPLSLVERTPILNELRTLQPDIIRYDTRVIAASVLSDFDVRYVIVHPLTMDGDERAVTNRVVQQMLANQKPVVSEPNLVAYRVPEPNPYRPYLVLGDGWGDVELVSGQSQRTIDRRADLSVRTRSGNAVALRLTAHARTQSAHVTIYSKWTLDVAEVLSEVNVTTVSSTIEIVSARPWIALEVSAPIAIESIELVAQ